MSCMEACGVSICFSVHIFLLRKPSQNNRNAVKAGKGPLAVWEPKGKRERALFTLAQSSMLPSSHYYTRGIIGYTVAADSPLVCTVRGTFNGKRHNGVGTSSRLAICAGSGIHPYAPIAGSPVAVLNILLPRLKQQSECECAFFHQILDAEQKLCLPLYCFF